MEATGLSKWFYLGIAAVIIGIIMIIRAKRDNKSKLMENGYLLFILGFVGIISEFTDFATVLLVFILISAIVLVLDKLFWRKSRKIYIDEDNKPESFMQKLWKKLTFSKVNGVVKDPDIPHAVYYAREFFPVVLIVWVLRAFLFEAYQIPTSSMRPDLIVGDFILVSKYDYGLRMPITNKVVIPVHDVKRGDVMVFQDQTAPNRDLIKRVIGLPGDTVTYVNKRLQINGESLDYQDDGTYSYSEPSADGEVLINNTRDIENLTGVKHPIITWDQVPPVMAELVKDFPGKENCSYNNAGFSCKVPVGHYFMMGDNRDNSLDSRYWGFVPNQAILGKAIYVLLNFHDLSRVGLAIK